MKALIANQYSDNLETGIEDRVIPSIADGEVLISVAAAGVNPLDCKLLSGAYQAIFPLQFPYIVGTDVAGVIEQVGGGVAELKVGDRVVARLPHTRGGAFANFAVAPVAAVTKLPPDVAFRDAAALPTAASAAHQALFDVGHLREGQTVLIHAGAGGVGSFAVQLAKMAGAKVIATATGDGVDVARSLGADEVIDYRQSDFAAHLRDVDLVIDTVGGPTQAKSYAVMKSGGTLVALVSPPNDEIARAAGVTATRMIVNANAERLALLVSYMSAGKLRVLIDREFPLDEARKALETVRGGSVYGKVVVGVA
jgi:NADPH:quinone reductase-like Zn-dependent oxidoreductase